MDASAIPAALLNFSSKVKIDSKESGTGPFRPYRSQIMLFEAIGRGLGSDVHDITILKARQLGISTALILVCLFWALANAGTQGALVTDDEPNKERFRNILSRYISSLPEEWVGAKITTHNRTQMIADNGSTLDYMVAGVRGTKASLGTSRAINLLHATECSNWGSDLGVDSLRAALAEINPNRLYIWESTAKGYNWYYDHCQAAKSDPARMFLFIGAWAKEDYRLIRGTPQFKFYWNGKATQEELQLVAEVWKLYKVKITQEQLAWRRMKAESMSPEGLMQEYPWTEEEAFVATGSSFFPSRLMLNIHKDAEKHPRVFRGLYYRFGPSFRETEIHAAKDPEEATLRVFEDPVPTGRYAIGIDPSYARGAESDYHVIQVLRCYADRVSQVAEYRARDVETYKVAWVLAHLAGAYRDCVANLEITGPGSEVMSELRALRQLSDSAHGDADPSFRNVVGLIRWYLYKRPDSMGSGFVYNWQTNEGNKARMLTGLRDSVILHRIHIRSMRAIEEMRSVVQAGNRIEAQGKNIHDDLVMGLGLAHVAWTDWVRPKMVRRGETWEAAHRGLPSSAGELAGAIAQNFLGRLGARSRRA